MLHYVSYDQMSCDKVSTTFRHPVFIRVLDAAINCNI